jgi:hypothetical protein
MQELLDQGWKNYHTCTTCSRSGPVQYWNNVRYPEYEIRVRTRRNTFTIWSKNLQVYGPAWLYQITDALKHFNIYAEKTV